MYAEVFQSILLLSFGVSVLFAGLFTAYFGAGKSRRIGVSLALLGVLAVLLFGGLTWDAAPALAGVTNWRPEEVVLGITAVIGALVGAAVALVIFLMSIMRA